MPDESRVSRVGEWRVDPDLAELSRDGQTIRLEPRTMRLLLCLAAHAGRVVDVQQLLDEVWPNVVVTQSSVYQAILQLRRILGDDSEHPSYIENVPRRGYRLIAPVAPCDAPTAATTDAAAVAQDLTQLTIRSVGAEQPAGSKACHAVWQNAEKVPAPEKSIAVLPFSNLSSDQENEYFGDGLAEEILNALSHIPELHVAARGSSFSFKNKGVNVSEIAERLGVVTVLEGSVRRAADRLRITVQLVDAKTGFHLWSERFDRRLSDIFEIQDEIAGAIAQRLKVTLGSVDTRPTANVEAYELYLRGRYAWHQRSPTTMHAALKDFEQSLKLDPNNALAFAGLADCYAVLSFYGWMPPGAARGPAFEAAQRAAALAPNLWETNYSRGLHIFSFERTWRSAQPFFENAAAINPRSAFVHTYFALFLATAGDADRAIAHLDLGRQLDPLSFFVHSFAAISLLILGRLEAAESAARQAFELQPDYLPALWGLGGILCRMERNEEGLPFLERAVQLSRAPFYVGWLGCGLARAGRHDEARRLLAELDERGSRGEFIPPLARLHINEGLADVAAVRSALAAAIELWQPPLPLCATVDLRPFRKDPDIDRMWREVFGS
jgi:TolB-like protein/DNA-binding winged helix-turn-helix (wHTH) protein/Tfp pilus assembly protein PilF